MTNEERLARGERARQILADDVFVDAWEGLERGAIEHLAACDTTDTKKLQALTMALQTVRAIRRRMEAWMAEGKDAAERIEREERKGASVANMFQRFRR